MMRDEWALSTTSRFFTDEQAVTIERLMNGGRVILDGDKEQTDDHQ